MLKGYDFDPYTGLWMRGNDKRTAFCIDFTFSLPQWRDLQSIPEIPAMMLAPQNKEMQEKVFDFIKFGTYECHQKSWWKDFVAFSIKQKSEAFKAAILFSLQFYCNLCGIENLSTRFILYAYNENAFGEEFKTKSYPLSRARKSYTKFKYTLHFWAALAVYELFFLADVKSNPLRSLVVSDYNRLNHTSFDFFSLANTLKEFSDILGNTPWHPEQCKRFGFKEIPAPQNAEKLSTQIDVIRQKYLQTQEYRDKV